MAAELPYCRMRECAEGVVVVVLQRGADDSDVGSQRGGCQVSEAREQFTPGEVSGGAEEHDDVWPDVLRGTAPGPLLGGRVRDGLNFLFRHIRDDVTASCRRCDNARVGGGNISASR